LGEHLFVYGTLKRGFGNHHFLDSLALRYSGVAKTEKCYPLVVHQLPFLIDREGAGHRVVGEVYELENGFDWQALDEFEGVPELYSRRKITIITDQATKTVPAWTYFVVQGVSSLLELPMLPSYSDRSTQ